MVGYLVLAIIVGVMPVTIKLTVPSVHVNVIRPFVRDGVLDNPRVDQTRNVIIIIPLILIIV